MELLPVDDEAWRVGRLCAFLSSLLALAAVLLSKFSKRLPCRWRACPQTKASTNRAHAHAGAGASRDADVDMGVGMAKLVEERLFLARLERTKFLCHGLSYLLGILVTHGVTISLRRGDVVNTHGTDILLWVLLNICILIMARPALMTAKVMENLTCALPLIFGLAISPLFATEKAPIMNSMVCNVLTIVVILVRRPRNLRTAPLFYLSLGFFTLCGVSNLWFFGGWMHLDAVTRDSHIVLGQTSIVLAALWWGSLCERGDRQLLTASLHLEEARELNAAARALLRYSFDVVVEVDGSGKITSPASELSSLVLRPWKNLQGTQLADLFTDEADRAQFSQRLSVCSHAAHATGVSLLERMAVSMRDASGLQLSMELLWFGFSRPSSRCFMIGIRENCSDPSGVEDAKDAKASATAGPEFQSESDEFSVNGDWELCDSQPAVVTVDAGRPGLPVQAVSTSFIVHFGRVPLGSDFTKYMRNSSAFGAWVQRNVNLWLYEEKQGKDYVVQLKLQKVVVAARCSLVVPDNGEDIALEYVNLLLKPLSSSVQIACTGQGTPSRPQIESGSALKRTSL